LLCWAVVDLVGVVRAKTLSILLVCCCLIVELVVPIVVIVQHFLGYL
jgi:hypothetical protein